MKKIFYKNLEGIRTLSEEGHSVHGYITEDNGELVPYIDTDVNVIHPVTFHTETKNIPSARDLLDVMENYNKSLVFTKTGIWELSAKKWKRLPSVKLFTEKYNEIWDRVNTKNLKNLRKCIALTLKLVKKSLKLTMKFTPWRTVKGRGLKI